MNRASCERFRKFDPARQPILGQASGLQKAQEQLGVQRASLGSLSEAAHVFDPDLLLPILAELARELRPKATDPRLKDIHHIVTAVDSTRVKTLPVGRQGSLTKSIRRVKRCALSTTKWKGGRVEFRAMKEPT